MKKKMNYSFCYRPRLFHIKCFFKNMHFETNFVSKVSEKKNKNI